MILQKGGGTSQINCPSSNVLNTNKIDETGPGDFFFYLYHSVYSPIFNYGIFVIFVPQKINNSISFHQPKIEDVFFMSQLKDSNDSQCYLETVITLSAKMQGMVQIHQQSFLITLPSQPFFSIILKKVSRRKKLQMKSGPFHIHCCTNQTIGLVGSRL